MTLTKARTVSAIVLLALALGGCAAGPREMPQEGTGSDQMKKSPCACMPLDFDAGGYLWRG